MQRASHPHETDTTGRAYCYPHLPCPETRARVTGYLAWAPEPVSGYRTDGAWVWPVALVDELRQRGYGPPRELLEHMRNVGYRPPQQVSDQVLDQAAAALRVAARPPDRVRVEYFIGPETAAAPVMRVTSGQDGGEPGSGTVEAFTVRGWVSVAAPQQALQGKEYRSADAAEATELLDAICPRWHTEQVRLAEETAPTDDGLRLARMYDATTPTGLPWFSPSRLRIVEDVRRKDIARYLRGGRLAVRATSALADPLSASDEPVVPLGYRTDGTWVWPEGLAYYMDKRGVAPELSLLTHIESRAYRLPTDLAAERIRAAAATVRNGPSPRPERAGYVYFAVADGGDEAEPTVMREARRTSRSAAGDPAIPRGLEVLGDGLRWTPVLAPVPENMVEISEEEAVRRLDSRWAARGRGRSITARTGSAG